MKRCPVCGREYSDSNEYCENCFVDLVSIPSNTDQSTDASASSGGRVNTPPPYDDRNARETEEPLLNGNHVHGNVVTTNQQQYYQAVHTKIINALLKNEPFQFGHTTFSTIVRVDEISSRGFSENSIDVIVFGNVQGIIAPGDTFDANVRRSFGRYIAVDARVNDAPVRTQTLMPAIIIRLVFLLIIAAIYGVIHFLTNGGISKTADSIAVAGMSLFDAILSIGKELFVVVIAVVLLFYLLRMFFRGR